MPEQIMPLPKGGTLWEHHSGRIYLVLWLTNLGSIRGEYPVQVTYMGENGKVWTGPANDWHRRMKPLVGKKHRGFKVDHLIYLMRSLMRSPHFNETMFANEVQLALTHDPELVKKIEARLGDKNGNDESGQ